MKPLYTNSKMDENFKSAKGIRSRLVLGFTLFVAIVLVIVWIFQVLLLDLFYEKTKFSELKKVQNGIEENAVSGNLDDVCGELASEYDVCIVVYSITDGKIRDVVISKEVSPSCIIHYADKPYLEALYTKALNTGGVFTQPYNIEKRDFVSNRNDINFGHKENLEKKKNHFNYDDNIVMAVSAKVFEDGIGNEYIAFINLKFTPVNSIQNTRNMQFAYIALVVIISSVIFALLFSSRIAHPLEKMTKSAQKMARGDFSAKFAVEGYMESRHLAQTLNFAMDEISKTDKLQRELIANVSHDLKTPLTLISGYAEMMRDIPGENNPANSQLIIDEAKRLTDLVNDILDFSKFSTGTEKAVLNTLNLTETIRQVIGRYGELVKRDGYVIDFIAEEHVAVCADERMILQVLYNLINNAINYTGNDKTVSIKQTVESCGIVKVSISDSGEGISKDDIDHIWDRYYKVDKTHARAVTGSGLGLSIVSKILQLHSASYGVETSALQGTTFWFSLKVVNE